MKCELCGKVHAESYGSGRFCSAKCARSFSSKIKRSEINQKVSQKLKGRKFSLTSSQVEDRSLKFKDTWIRKNAKVIENLRSLEFDKLSQPLKRRKILLEQNGKCAECGIDEFWNGKPLKFEVDHVSGDRTDNTRKNLRCLCPNCHSQTDTYKTLNHIGGKKISDNEFCIALMKNDSIYKALLSLNLNPHGGNYKRARRLIRKYQLEVPYLLI